MSHHPDSIRINKAISDSGFCSRRQADTYIEQGRVTINDKKVSLGDRAMPEDIIHVDGNLISENSTLVYIMLNKPVGITCTTDLRIEGNVVDFIGHKERIFHVGRLDKPSEGLLLMTNDGDIVNKILRAGNQHEKEYIVTVDRPITKDFINRMSSGVPLSELETTTKRCEVEQLSRFVFRIVLVQGLNRQIRRMCEYLGYDVVALKRIRIMNLLLEDLPLGEWRDVTEKELLDLKASVENSDNSSFVDSVINKPKRSLRDTNTLPKTNGRRRRGRNNA
jgi:23S rRNA pseudouridine2604 synthase